MFPLAAMRLMLLPLFRFINTPLRHYCRHFADVVDADAARCLLLI